MVDIKGCDCTSFLHKPREQEPFISLSPDLASLSPSNPYGQGRMENLDTPHWKRKNKISVLF